MNVVRSSLNMTKPKAKRPPSSLLGLKLERNRIEGVVVRRSGSGVQIQKSFQASMALDPLTNDVELVGREILNQLNAAGIRERRCAVCLPLHWALTLQVAVPEIPEEDVAEFLNLEAEKGFPYPPEELMMGTSRFRTSTGEQLATLVAIPRNHVVLLEKALKAARLKPVSFSLAVTSVQTADAETTGISLWVSDSIVELQVISGDGIVAVRSIQSHADTEAGSKAIDVDALAREIKITLGQLPRSIGQLVRKVRLFGRAELTKGLLKELRGRVEVMGLEAELGTGQRINGFTLPAGTDEAMSPAFGLAARCILAHPPAFEFLPPKVSRFPQLVAQFSSRRMFPIAAAAVFVLGVFGGPMGYRLWQESRLQSDWNRIEKQVNELAKIEGKSTKFQPWYNDFSVLNMYSNLVNCFPASGAEAYVMGVKFKEPTQNAATANEVTIQGFARDVEALTKLGVQLKKSFAKVDVKKQVRSGNGWSFDLTFLWLGRPIVPPAPRTVPVKAAVAPTVTQR